MNHDDDAPRPGVSRRSLLKSGGAAGVAAALGAAGASSGAGAAPAGAGRPTIVPGAAPGDDAPDLLFVNGRIHTMDAADSIVSSVSITGGRFSGVGRGARAAGPGTKVINLRGRTVVPGIVESHIHIVSLANRPGYHTITENARSIAQVQAALAARRPDVPAGQFITSLGGFHTNMFAERRFPTLAELDAAVPDRPLFMFQGFTGPSVTNSLGKAFFESATIPVVVGTDGFITAGIQSTTALYGLRVLQTFEDKKRSTLDAMTYAVSTGLTASLDQVLFPTPGPLQPNQALSNLDHYRMYDSWLALQREGRTIHRLQTNFLHNQNDPALPELKERLKNQFQFFGSDMMMTGAIGEWAAPLGAGAVWLEAQRLVAQARWRNENAVGSIAQLEQVVSAYEAMDAEFGIRDLRWMVHHVPFVTTALLNRLRTLGGGVVMRGFTWIVGTPTANGAPFRTILDNGIKAGIEGDGVHISTLTPWPHMQYAVTGVNALGQLINGGQQITRREALRAFTRENAWFLRMEDEIGSIEPGKLGDLIVLDKDYFEVPEAAIETVRSDLTVVGGAVVHDTGSVG